MVVPKFVNKNDKVILDLSYDDNCMEFKKKMMGF